MSCSVVIMLELVFNEGPPIEDLTLGRHLERVASWVLYNIHIYIYIYIYITNNEDLENDNYKYNNNVMVTGHDILNIKHIILGWEER